MGVFQFNDPWSKCALFLAFAIGDNAVKCAPQLFHKKKTPTLGIVITSNLMVLLLLLLWVQEETAPELLL